MFNVSIQLIGIPRMRLLSTMQAQERSSCVIFTPHSNEHDFVSFERGDRFVFSSILNKGSYESGDNISVHVGI